MAGRTYAVIGGGALGGFYGARLQRAGREVHFLLRSDADHVRRHGWRIDSVEGNFVLPRVSAFGDPRQMPHCDVTLIALKTTQNGALGNILPCTVKPGGVALVLQNGLGIEDDVARIVGGQRVMGGLAFLCSHKVGPGHIHHLDYGAVTLGDYRPDHRSAGITARMREVGSDFEAAGIPLLLEEDLQAARWRKLVWNIPFSGLCTLQRLATDRIMAASRTRDRARRLMEEVVNGARACGHMVPDAFIEKMMEDTDRMVAYRPSMLIDFEKGNPLEIEAILGNPLRAVAAMGVRLPELERMCDELRALERGSPGMRAHAPGASA